jgi:PTS system mannose-specific IIC component
MISSILLIVLASAFTGFIILDRAAFGQFLISRPIVAAPLLGFLSGCPVEGIIAGLVFELLFLNSLPVGSFIPDQALFPALLSVLMVKIDGGLTAMPAAVIVALPSLFLDRLADRRWRRRNERAFHKAEVYIRLGRADLAERLHRIAILRAGLYNMLAFLLSCVFLIPLYSLVLGRFNGIPVLFSSTGMVPFLAGLAALTVGHVQGTRWIGFGIGLALGITVGAL